MLSQPVNWLLKYKYEEIILWDDTCLVRKGIKFSYVKI